MARILIKLISATSLNLAKNALLYKRGDVVKVTEDGYFFGNLIESNKNPKFGIMDVPGASVAAYLSLVEPGMEATGQKDEVKMVLRRRLALNLDAMTVDELGDLEGSEKRVVLTEARLTALTEVKV